MIIAFVGGTGEEGMGLAYRFAKAGHDCIIGSRSVEKAQAAVAELLEKEAALPVNGAENGDAVARADIIIVTTPYTAQAATLPPLAPDCAGKIVISTVVPMAFEGGRASLLSVPEGSAAQQEQALLPDAPPSLLRIGKLGHRVRAAEGPERLEPEWWRDRPDRLGRDYYRVELSSGVRLWVCRSGFGGAARWFLHGRM